MRLSLLVSALGFGGFGLLLLIAPQTLGVVGVEIARPAGAVELRGFYGGLELGLAAFFALSLLRREWWRPALLVQVLALGGVVFGRVLGLLVGEGEALLYLFLVAESAGAALGVWALRSLDVTEGRGEPS